MPLRQSRSALPSQAAQAQALLFILHRLLSMSESQDVTNRLLLDRVGAAFDWRHGDDQELAALLIELEASLVRTPETLDVERLAAALPGWMVEHPLGKSESELGTGSISTEQAFGEALDLIAELVGYLRSWTSDEEEGEVALEDRARAFVLRYRPAEDQTS